MVCCSGGNRIPPYGRWGDDTGSASLAGMVTRPMGGGGVWPHLTVNYLDKASFAQLSAAIVAGKPMVVIPNKSACSISSAVAPASIAR